MGHEKTDSNKLDGNSLDDNRFFVNYTKSYDNGNLLDNYLDNSNIRMANTNNTKVLYIFSSNSSPDFSTMS